MYKITKEGFSEIKTGQIKRSILYTDKGYSESWLKKQEASYDEYQETHEEGNHSEYIRNIFSFYKSVTAQYILKALDNTERINVLDVGCGISTKVPDYVPESDHINYIGLDPIEKNPERDYHFICSRLENIGNILEPDSIDVFMFSTSLDHFEDINTIYPLLKKIGKKNAYIIMVSGTHDTGVIASLDAMNFMNRFTNSGHFSKGVMGKLKYINRLRIFNQNMLKNYNNYALRAEKLKKKTALDNLHFHYFEIEPYIEFLKTKMGEFVEYRKLELGNIIISVNKIV
ncbi:MAG: hypothetical protein ACXVC6_05520 [Bacteroidia bacterium]